MVNKLRKSIFNDIVKAGYFSILVDSTPDISHIDRWTIIVRYVSFSALKRVKNYLRSSMGQEKVSDLSLLFIEKEKLHKMNFDDVIQDFAAEKSRKKLKMYCT
ncbi:uncharacterized protein LOC142317577 [Lycorma delicatula]|uniref:uncharacterized protein LOC142317577 n=1 Tax=Lycorma delicatula TaxID=130591 RepID=UPI003F515C2B